MSTLTPQLSAGPDLREIIFARFFAPVLSGESPFVETLRVADVGDIDEFVGPDPIIRVSGESNLAVFTVGEAVVAASVWDAMAWLTVRGPTAEAVGKAVVELRSRSPAV